MMKEGSYWEHLAESIEPVMRVGEILLGEVASLAGEYGIDLNSEVNWEEVPADFRERLQGCIVSEMKGIADIPVLGDLLKSGDLYQTVFEQLEVQYARMEKRDVSARGFLQQLMQVVMDVSISTGKMSLADWHGMIEGKKEARKVEDVAEYVYKKLCAAHQVAKKESIYDYFYNNSSPDEIDRLLGEAKESLTLASAHRGMTKKRGQGMSRFMIDYIHQWQERKLMKPMKSVFPFCQCLERHWDGAINLGTRQGLEATYKMRL